MSKSFFGVTVLDGFDLSLRSAEVHALLGHNGSGKSTFAKILSGFHLPDAAPDGGAGPRVMVDGRPLTFGDPDSARSLGIRFVHQELGLLGPLTVLENLRLGSRSYATRPGWRISWRKERARAEADLARVGVDVSPEIRFGDLSAVLQTEVAIARALQDESAVRVLVLDEVTAALPDVEVRRLFAAIDRVRRLGVAVLYVTHRLEEVYEVADSVTVLRGGRIVGRGTTTELTRSEVVDLIVGHAPAAAVTGLEAGSAAEGRPPARSLLEVESISGGDVSELSCQVRAGEIVGVAGLVGSGVHDVSRLLNGQIRPTGGAIRVDGEPLVAATPVAARGAGLVVLPARRNEKLIQEMTVKENMTLNTLGRFFRGGIFRAGEERAFATAVTKRNGIRCASVESPVRTLSGGNQQKVAIARSLESSPKVLVLDEPTQGVDVGGKDEVFTMLRKAADDGLAVLICSSDLAELEQICQRVLVMRTGKIATELAGSAITRDSILRESYGR